MEKSFVFLFRHIRPEEALQRLEKFRTALASQPVVFNDAMIDVSTSMGVATQVNGPVGAKLAVADKLLYEAKAAGRNYY